MSEKSESRGKYLAKKYSDICNWKCCLAADQFFLVPLYTNILTTSEYGVVDLINTVCTVLAPILILNISEAVMRFAL